MAKWYKTVCTLAAVTGFYSLMYSVEAHSDSRAMTDGDLAPTRSYIKEKIEEYGIPGASVTIIKDGETLINEGYGYAHIEAAELVTEETLFEVGSLSKGYTGLAIRLMEQEGLLILDDPVEAYIPWLQFEFKGDSVPITLSQLLHHTSGINFKSISDIPVATGELSIEETVRTVYSKNQELEFYPGSRQSYASVNYSILGLVIETVSGKTYEEYMQQEVFNRLGLKSTYIYEAPDQSKVAEGYKAGYFSPRPYQSPPYRGHAPAAHIITNIKDQNAWLRANMGLGPATDSLSQALAKSKVPDYSLAPTIDGSMYASGWRVKMRGSPVYYHAGTNPSYSSFAAFDPERGVAVAILANRNHIGVEYIGQKLFESVANYPTGKGIWEDVSEQKDLIAKVDVMSSSVVVLFVFSIALSLVLSVRTLRRVKEYDGLPSGAPATSSWVNCIAAVVFLSLFAICSYFIPEVFFNGVNWRFINVWGPVSFAHAVILANVLMVALSLFVATAYVKGHGLRDTYVSLGVVSVLSGFGNSLLIITVVQAVHLDNALQNKLYLFFVLGLFAYVVGQIFVRCQLILQAEDIIVKTRKKLAKAVLNAEFEDVSSKRLEAIQTAMITDSHAISDIPEIFTSLTTSCATLVACFIYLGTISPLGLAISLLVIAIAVSVYGWMARAAEAFLSKRRSYEDIYFGGVNDMLHGIKELNIDPLKRRDFGRDLHAKNKRYEEYGRIASLKFSNAFIVGELIFTLVVGAVAFSYLGLIDVLSKYDLISFVVVFLYMTGPVNSAINAVPRLLRIRISWRRIKSILDDMASANRKAESIVEHIDSFVTLSVSNVQYVYREDQENRFRFGPISFRFNKGEVVFITGGNGSGKSTLMKLIVGLFTQSSGDISINGKAVSGEERAQYCTVIFSDCHIFKELYGIEKSVGTIREVNSKLSEVGMSGKVSASKSGLDTTALSTGQRKRLALALSMCENKPICIFDEWAAEQDPGFRHHFYTDIVPALQKQGKLVIVITHDDQHFGLADRIFKLNEGREQVANSMPYGSERALINEAAT